MRAWGRLFIVVVSCASLVAQAAGIDLDTPPAGRRPIRSDIHLCRNYLVPAEQTDDSVGIPFDARNAAEFEAQIREALGKYGPERFRNGTFYVLGKKMSDELEQQATYTAALDRLGLSALGSSVKVLSVPDGFIEKESRQLARDILQRMRYFFFSKKRDYQTPQVAEVSSGWTTTAILEVPSVIFLYGTLPVLDANLTVASHAITLGAYNIYVKSMMNWLLRPGGPNGRPDEAELFLKQILLSAPFVVNYNVFGRFSEILNFYAANGWAATAGAFPAELSSFATTQGLTLLLQTIFYSQVVTKGFGAWANNQTGEENSRLARAAAPWLKAPILMLDGMVLAMASSNWGEPLLTLGPAELNWGHVSLMALTATGAAFFAKFPRGLDRTLPAFAKAEAWRRAGARWMFEPSRRFKSPLFQPVRED